MNRHNFLSSTFVIAFGSTLLGALLKAEKRPPADTLLMIGVLASVIFLITAIHEVNGSQRINKAKKWVWIAALLFLNGIAAIFYLRMRKKIADAPSTATRKRML